jgi:2,3-bisphosphoglycerate-independent phosphoglycerate mutase
MTRYSEDQTAPYAFGPRPQRDGLGETLAKNGKTQLRIAETEKYPHVTFFFSGGMETPWDGEERILVNSPDVPTYDLQPEMSAPEVTEKVVAAILSGKFDAIILNFAQTDMVGHTGSLEAAIKSVEAADAGLGEVMRAIEEVSGALLVIADHGNVEQMIDLKTGKPHTAHTTNPVPCILFGAGFEGAKLRDGGRLADIAPTLLDLMGVEKPAAMTGVSLLGESPHQVDQLESGALAQSFSAMLQKSVAGTVNPALSRAEVVAALREGETRLIYTCENQSDELAGKLADSAKNRLELLV